MSLLTHPEICALIDQGVITGVDLAQVNATSLDIRLGTTVYTEKAHDDGQPVHGRVVRAWMGESLALQREELRLGDEVIFRPGEFKLCCSLEEFNLPDDITAVMHLKSSTGRMGLNHMLAGYCDPGWHASHMTLELHNSLRYHTTAWVVGQLIAQVSFVRHTAVPESASYRATGRYNGDKGATPAKGVGGVR